MRVFMLGWEFPPHISGGLGTACYGLTRGLDEVGVEVCFVLPESVPVEGQSHVDLRTPASLPGLAHLADLPDTPLGYGPARGEGGGEAGQPIPIDEAFKHLAMYHVDARLQPYGSPQRQSAAGGLDVLADMPMEIVFGPVPPSAAVSPSAPRAAVGQPTGLPGVPLPAAAPARGAGPHYGGDLMAQVYRYARLAVELAKRETFDVVHAHDWMTYPAGAAVAAASRKPLVVHVHSTEFDRAGENVNQQVYEIERMGMHSAQCVVCVSHLTGRIVASRYAVAEDHIEVVYNAVALDGGNELEFKPIRHTEKIVLFLGRVTMQKGPEYFLRAARKVVDNYQNVRFVMAGSGDMMVQCIREVADLRLGRYVTFTGFLRGRDVDRVFSMADLYVMPSVSEPFGIAPLEALSHNVPVLISKQSGVSEVLTHVLKVDFWDIDEMANKILAVLRHPPLQRTLRQHGQIELRKLSWKDSAAQLKDIYVRVTGGGGGKES